MDAEPEKLSLSYEKTVFPSIFSPSIDLFTSGLNAKLPKFIPYRLGTESKAVNAESLILDRPKILCFPSIYMFAQSYSENMARWSRGNTGSTCSGQSTVSQSVV